MRILNKERLVSPMSPDIVYANCSYFLFFSRQETTRMMAYMVLEEIHRKDAGTRASLLP
jgi:hypothetical protein